MTVKLRGSQSITLGIDVAKPSLNMGEKMRLLAVRATQRCDVTRQVSKALRVQLHTSIDHIAGSRTYKLQNAHRYILTLLALIRRDEKPRAASHPRGQSAVRTERKYYEITWSNCPRQGDTTAKKRGGFAAPHGNSNLEAEMLSTQQAV